MGKEQIQRRLNLSGKLHSVARRKRQRANELEDKAVRLAEKAYRKLWTIWIADYYEWKVYGVGIENCNQNGGLGSFARVGAGDVSRAAAKLPCLRLFTVSSRYTGFGGSMGKEMSWASPYGDGFLTMAKILLLFAALPKTERQITLRRVVTILEVYGVKA